MTFPDGKQREFDSGTTAQMVAAAIGKRLEADAVAAKVDGVVVDLMTPITRNCAISIITRGTKEGLEVIRHSTAHLLAHAIKELFPTAQITIGPVIEDGFYYDIDCPQRITVEDLVTIEKKMAEIAGRKLSVTRHVWSKDKAIAFFSGQKEAFKVEIIRDLEDPQVSVYSQGEFSDLCRGPHVPNTDRLGKFKLLSVAGAYWRGSEKNPMLQRIYGTAFATQAELDQHLHQIEEAKRRDHRKLGPELGLFTFLPVAPAMPFYLPKGALIFNLLKDFISARNRASGYQEVICPQLMSSTLWKTSGHWDNYRDNMFVTESGKDEEEPLCLKPMNCPGHATLFGSTKHSYRELPVRFSEYTKLHRFERAGVTHGLFRTRAFCQDDGHIFCRPDQIQSEAVALIREIGDLYRLFGFDTIQVRLATRPENAIGSSEIWDLSTKALEDALGATGQAFEWAPGEGAFYGPKIEFHIRDSIGRWWQCGTIQLDFNFPERFQLEYTDSDNQAKRPAMIHRAIFGSLERFFGVLVEHYAGHFPLWLAPVQARVLNVSMDQVAYAEEVAKALSQAGFRVEPDIRNEKLGYKIREAQLAKVPLMIVLGPQEQASKTVSVRKVSGESQNGVALDGFIEGLRAQLAAPMSVQAS